MAGACTTRPGRRSGSPWAARLCTRMPFGIRACSARFHSRGSGRGSAGRSWRGCAASCGAMFSHHTCAKPRNRRCSGVKPSMVSVLPFSASCKRHVGDPHAAVVRGVLAEREAAVELHIVNRGEAGIFVGYAGDAFFELGAVLRRSTSRADCRRHRTCGPGRRSRASSHAR